MRDSIKETDRVTAGEKICIVSCIMALPTLLWYWNIQVFEETGTFDLFLLGCYCILVQFGVLTLDLRTGIQGGYQCCR